MKNTKILLVILPFFWPKMPPLGLWCLKSYAEKFGIKVDILDSNAIFYNLSTSDIKKLWFANLSDSGIKQNFSSITKKYAREYNRLIRQMFKYNLLGFSCFRTNLFPTLQIAGIIKSKRRDSKIILGGPEITRQFFRTGGKFDSKIKDVSDFMVVGEGEKAFINFIYNGPRLNQISKFSELDNLYDLPFLRYKDLDINTYPENNAAQFMFSRGCIRKCTFCSERLLYKKFRIRRVYDVIDEISYNKNKGIKYFIFNDSLINADLEALEALCDAIIKNFGSINWEAQAAIRTDMNQDLFNKMKQSGCYNLFIGLESGCNKTLKNMHKGYTKDDALSFFKKLNKAGLSFGISLIVGYPKETYRDFKHSLDFVIKNKRLIPKIEQINPFTYYHGTAVDKTYDYKPNPEALKRFSIFVDAIKRHKIKHTNAFLGNLIENGRIY